ncbi:MAG: hypothetical protein JXR23_09960 [Pontiellaceae bacterium]|nr:hypothetical protein [Pontiellaceae bacterium]
MHAIAQPATAQKTTSQPVFSLSAAKNDGKGLQRNGRHPAENVAVPEIPTFILFFVSIADNMRLFQWVCWVTCGIHQGMLSCKRVPLPAGITTSDPLRKTAPVMSVNMYTKGKKLAVTGSVMVLGGPLFGLMGTIFGALMLVYLFLHRKEFSKPRNLTPNIQ